MTITGFKSTDIESRSKVEPATVTNFGYKRQGLDVNAITGLFLVTAATCSAGTTSSIAVMSPASTVRAGDVLDFNGIRSEISLVSGTSYTLGRAVTGLTTGSSVNIYRPSYFLLDSTGVASFNLVQVGGVAVTLGQKAEAASIPVVLATEQDTAKDGTETSQGQFTGIGVLKAAPFEGNPAWAAWPASEAGIPYVGVYGFDESTQVQANINSSITSFIANGSTLRGLFTRSFIQGPDSSNTSNLRTAYIATTTPGASDPALVVRNIPSGTQTVTGVVTAVPSLGAASLTDRGKVAGSSLTTSYQTLLSMSGDAVTLHVWNSTEVPVIVSFDAGSSETLELGPYENYSEDFGANDRYLTMADIEVKLVSGSAAVNGGSVRCKITI